MRILPHLVLSVTCLCGAVSLGSVLDPTDPNNWGTNSTPYTGDYKPQTPVNGAIKIATMTGDVIEWWNFESHVFEVEWRATLTDGSWTNIGEGYKTFEHNHPEGFYRVIERDDKAVFPVWNSGTTNMSWGASTDCEWLAIYCVNTNIPPEWGEGYVIAGLTSIPTNGSQGIITIYTIGAKTEQSKQVTVLYE